MNGKEMKRRVKRIVWPQYSVEPQSAEAPNGECRASKLVFLALLVRETDCVENLRGHPMLETLNAISGARFDLSQPAGMPHDLPRTSIQRYLHSCR